MIINKNVKHSTIVRKHDKGVTKLILDWKKILNPKSLQIKSKYEIESKYIFYESKLWIQKAFKSNLNTK